MAIDGQSRSRFQDKHLECKATYRVANIGQRSETYPLSKAVTWIPGAESVPFLEILRIGFAKLLSISCPNHEYSVLPFMVCSDHLGIWHSGSFRNRCPGVQILKMGVHQYRNSFSTPRAQASNPEILARESKTSASVRTLAALFGNRLSGPQMVLMGQAGVEKHTIRGYKITRIDYVCKMLTSGICGISH